MSRTVTSTDTNTGDCSAPGRPSFSNEDLTAPCKSCRDRKCWKGCHNVHNPFGQLGNELKKLRGKLPPNSCWTEIRVCREVAHWSYRIYSTHYRKSKWCRKRLNQMAEEILHNMHHGTVEHDCKEFKSRPRNLASILGLLGGFDSTKDLLEQVRDGLTNLEEYLDYLWMTETCKRDALADDEFRELMKAHRRESGEEDEEEEQAEEEQEEEDEQENVPERQGDQENVASIPPCKVADDQIDQDREGQGVTSGGVRPLDTPPRTPPSVGQAGPDGSSQTQQAPRISYGNEIQGIPNRSAPTPPKMSPTSVDIGSSQSPGFEPSPPWTAKYYPGSLVYIGLSPGQFDISNATPEGKVPGPPGVHRGTDRRPKLNWLMHALLSRAPGGWLSSKVLKDLVVEWCPWYGTDAEKEVCRRSVGQTAAKDTKFSREIRNGVEGRRIAVAGEEQAKRPGPGHPRNDPGAGQRKRKLAGA